MAVSKHLFSDDESIFHFPIEMWFNLRMDSSLNLFFKPQGVVVIGASTSPEKLGYGVARNLIQSGYPGAVHFVSQKQGELFGRKLYKDVSQVPDPVVLAILIVPPNATPRTIQDCAKRGIKAAIIVSSGFREVGVEGAALEQQCIEVARAYGVRVLGPNCIGTIDTYLPLDTTFLQPPMPAQGHIGFISHSGAFCAAIIDWSRREGFGFSQIISLGNQADVNETDALAAMAEEEHTRVILLYMESVSDGRRFVDVAREVTQHKPVIALKVGRYKAGQKAAASHTGALAASDTTFEAAFEKAGILRASSTEQMFDWARALESYPHGFPLRGLRDTRRDASTALLEDHSSLHYSASTMLSRTDVLAARTVSVRNRIAVLTNAGGPGVIAADALEDNGLQLAQLSDVTLKSLATILPAAASLHNPVDMLASASPETYACCLKILLEDENVDGVMVILPPPPMFKAEVVAERLVDVIEQFRKPVVVALLGSTLVETARSTLDRSNHSTGSGQAVPTYPFPERAASGLGALLRRAQNLDDGPLTMDNMVNRQRSMVNYSLEELLAAYKIPIAPIKLAHDQYEAKSIAYELGYPVVMKIASPDILHKSDVGAVVLNIQDDKSLFIAYTQIMKSIQELKQEARIEGVHIQREIPNGQEVIVGSVRDPQFGPLMMFGSGGVEVEGLKDVAFALAPLTQAEASKMIRKTWAGRKLGGFRNIHPADEESVTDVLVKLSRLVFENEFIQEIEINPLRVLSKGAFAVDVRLK